MNRKLNLSWERWRLLNFAMKAAGSAGPPHLDHVAVFDGYLISTDGHRLHRVPASAVFGKKTPESGIYFISLTQDEERIQGPEPLGHLYPTARQIRAITQHLDELEDVPLDSVLMHGIGPTAQESDYDKETLYNSVGNLLPSYLELDRDFIEPLLPGAYKVYFYEPKEMLLFSNQDSPIQAVMMPRKKGA